MSTEKYYYEIHVCGKEGFSTAIVSDTPLDDRERITMAVKLGQIDSDDVDYVDYTDELSKEEYDESFADLDLYEDEDEDGVDECTPVFCNNCGFEGVEDELVTLTDLSDNDNDHDIHYFKGCPHCLTDDYLTD